MNNIGAYFQRSLNNISSNFRYDVKNTLENNILTSYSLWNNDIGDNLINDISNSLVDKLYNQNTGDR